MDIRPDLRPSSPVAPAKPVRADGARPEGVAAEATPADAPPAADRVEISAQARTQAARTPGPKTESLEIEVARTALRTGGGLSDGRLHELRERVRTGYYDYPEAVDRIAEAAARDLAGDE